MFFSSIKEINMLISKRMSNIYLKVTIEENWLSQNFDFLSLKFVSRSDFGELHLPHRYHWVLELLIAT